MPKGGRFAAAGLVFHIKPLAGARLESARAVSSRAEIPKGGRSAAAAVVFGITLLVDS